MHVVQYFYAVAMVTLAIFNFLYIQFGLEMVNSRDWICFKNTWFSAIEFFKWSFLFCFLAVVEKIDRSYMYLCLFLLTILSLLEVWKAMLGPTEHHRVNSIILRKSVIIFLFLIHNILLLSIRLGNLSTIDQFPLNDFYFLLMIILIRSLAINVVKKI